MTDPSLSPDQEEAVRRALAEARHTGPPPPEVVARLDAVLEDLAASRRGVEEDRPAGAPSAGATVIPLSSRRRRRAGAMLVAAAAVVAVGVGIGPLVDSWRGGLSGDDSTSATTLRDDAGVADGDAAAEQAAPESFSADRDSPGSPPEEARAASAPPRVRPAHFDADVAAVRDNHARLTGARSPEAPADPAPLSESQAEDLGDGRTPYQFRADCGPAPGPAEEAVPVVYRRLQATLVFREPADGSQRVDLYVCGRAAVQRTTTLSVP